jgi:hypothetical protein
MDKRSHLFIEWLQSASICKRSQPDRRSRVHVALTLSGPRDFSLLLPSFSITSRPFLQLPRAVTSPISDVLVPLRTQHLVNAQAEVQLSLIMAAMPLFKLWSMKYFGFEVARHLDLTGIGRPDNALEKDD